MTYASAHEFFLIFYGCDDFCSVLLARSFVLFPAVFRRILCSVRWHSCRRCFLRLLRGSLAPAFFIPCFLTLSIASELYSDIDSQSRPFVSLFLPDSILPPLSWNPSPFAFLKYFRPRKFAYSKKNAYLCTAKFALGSPTGANAGRPVGRAEAGVALSI